MSTAVDVAQLRARAGELRRIARRVGDTPAVDVHRFAGVDTWVGPVAQSCLDDLLIIRRELESSRDMLIDAARRLERHADELAHTALLSSAA
jgi:hypothetical protein